MYGSDPGTALQSSASTDERMGDCLGNALAWRGVQALSNHLGKERFQALMRAALGLPLPDKLKHIATARGTEALPDDAGLPLPQLARILAQALGPAPAHAAAPALQVDAARIAGNMVELRYRLANRPPAQEVAIHYRSLLPAQSLVYSGSTRVIPAQDAGVLPSTFVRGRHVLVFAEMRDPDLACAVRFGAVRKELP